MNNLRITYESPKNHLRFTAESPLTLKSKVKSPLTLKSKVKSRKQEAGSGKLKVKLGATKKSARSFPGMQSRITFQNRALTC